MFPNQEVVESVLSPLEGDIIEVFENAWSDWWGNPDRAKYTNRSTRASMIWNRTFEHAQRVFEDNSDVRVIEKDNTFYYLYKDEVLFRLKKGDENGLSRNYPTQTALAFYDPQAELFDTLPEIQRVDIVYALNELETAIDNVMVVGRVKNQVIWTYSLQREKVADIMDITPVAKPQQVTKKQLFTPKADIAEQNAKEE